MDAEKGPIPPPQNSTNERKGVRIFESSEVRHSGQCTILALGRNICDFAFFNQGKIASEVLDCEFKIAVEVVAKTL